MKRKILIAIVAIIGMSMFFACSQKKTEQGITEEKATTVAEPSNGIFEIISVSNKSVEFKTVAETQFYALALVSGEQVFEGKNCSNAGDTVKWANGSRFLPGSNFSMPVVFNSSAMKLPTGIVMTIDEFDATEDFSAEKIRFLTEEGATAMYYNIPKLSWDK